MLGAETRHLKGSNPRDTHSLSSDKEMRQVNLNQQARITYEDKPKQIRLDGISIFLYEFTSRGGNVSFLSSLSRYLDMQSDLNSSAAPSRLPVLKRERKKKKSNSIRLT